MDHISSELTDQLTNYKVTDKDGKTECPLCVTEKFLENNTTSITSNVYALAKHNPHLAYAYFLYFLQQMSCFCLLGEKLMQTMDELNEPLTLNENDRQTRKTNAARDAG